MYQFHVYLQRKVLHTQLRRSSQGQEILWTSEIYRSHDLIFYSNLHPFFTIWLEWFLTLPFLQASGVSCTTLICCTMSSAICIPTAAKSMSRDVIDQCHHCAICCHSAFRSNFRATLSVLGPLIRLRGPSRTCTLASICRCPDPKSQVPSSRHVPVLPTTLSTLAPLLVGTRSLIGTNEGLTPPGHFKILTVLVRYATHMPTLKVRQLRTPTTVTWPKFFRQQPQPPP